jgi:hypothetical protein
MKPLLAALFLGTALAQQPQTPPQPPPPPIASGQQQGDAANRKPEKKMSPEEAQKLFASIDDVFQFVSHDTKLPIKRMVPKKLADRDQVEKYIISKMDEDEDTKRFERSSIVLKKFGLIPRNFELRPFLVKLMRDQVAGFYDVKTKTVYLLDWVDPEIQKPVMAHELTHALQDQNFDLEKWGKDTERDKAEKAGDYNKAIALDEASTAETAIVEGQGMITLVDWMLKPYGRNAADSPAVIASMSSGMESDDSSEVMKEAPMLLRESLIFPYRDGMRFVSAVLEAQGREAAFSGLFHRPPMTSYEVLTPKAYLEQKEVKALPLPNMKALLGENYSEYDLGAMGEFDAELLMKQFGDTRTARTVTPEWDGGSYFAALRKGADPAQTSSIALVYVSRWKTQEAAIDFAKIYAGSLVQKYKSLKPAECSPCEEGERRWTSEEGFIEIDQRGNRVIVSEGLEQPAAIKFRDAALAGGGEQMVADKRDLSLRIVPNWIRAMIGPPALPRLRP